MTYLFTFSVFLDQAIQFLSNIEEPTLITPVNLVITPESLIADIIEAIHLSLDTTKVIPEGMIVITMDIIHHSTTMTDTIKDRHGVITMDIMKWDTDDKIMEIR